MSSINTPIINLINQHLSEYITYIKELENIIESLNKKLDDLTNRHNEIKQVYIEADQENTMLRKENNELKIKQESLVMDVKELSNKSSFYPQTPSKTDFYNSNVLPPNQKVKHRAYKNSLNSNLNTNRVLNFDQAQQDQTSNLMNKLLDKGLMNELEKSINEYSHQQTYASNNENCKVNIQSKKPCIHRSCHNIYDVYMNLNYIV